jgi:hypothetical protein
MAARRLIIVLVLLLVISSVAAQLAQPPTTGDKTTGSETSTTSTIPADQQQEPGQRLLQRRVSAGAAEPTEIRAVAGDQLELLVSVREPGSVEIPGLGLIEAAAPRSPARFNLLLRRTGQLRVVATGGTAALIIVRAAGSG